MRTLRHIATLVAWLLGQVGAQAAGPSAPFEPPARATLPEAAAAAMPAVQGLRTGLWPAALVDGRWLVPGEAVGAGRLAEVRRDGVVWIGADGQRKWIAWPAQPATQTNGKDEP